jgi:pimeloyl-ACP methyl ester carboxylesterase
MGLIFKDAFHDSLGTWPLAYIPYGGPDFGELEAVGRAVGDGDDDAFHRAWIAAGDRQIGEAEAALAAGRRRNARELYLRASAFYATSYQQFFGEPVDPRLLAGFRKQIDAFERGLALGEPPVAPMRIPFGDVSLPAYLIPADGRAGEVRPLLIFTNGYDSTVTQIYFAGAVAAARRGYHCLLFDGPGQGEPLYEHGIRLRPDWETVIAAVVDFAVALPGVDPARIALHGWSLGGHLAPRAAAGEPRLAACIADPGQWGMADSFRGVAARFGAPPEAVADFRKLDSTILAALGRTIESDRRLRWAIEQRGYWVHGVGDLPGYLGSIEAFTLAGRAGLIGCPTLLTLAENDPLTVSTTRLLDALRCPKTLLRFTAAEGAGDHCEMRNRSLLNRRTLDWLDDVLADG